MPRGRSSTSSRRIFRPIGSLICEVFTPAGNWSSYPPHKHDVDRPPGEVKLEEIYYYRFDHPDAYGIQRLYDRRADRAVTVPPRDVMLIRSGYHPFVTAYGYNAYYLNVLAGTRRSMAASDDPRYAGFRKWPAPDARVPLVTPPGWTLRNAHRNEEEDNDVSIAQCAAAAVAAILICGSHRLCASRSRDPHGCLEGSNRCGASGGQGHGHEPGDGCLYERDDVKRGGLPRGEPAVGRVPGSGRSHGDSSATNRP
jgi:hypothetical protein